MNDILSRARRLPPAWADGRLTHCLITTAGGRVRFMEPPPALAYQRRRGLRTRATWALTSLAAAGVALLANGVVRAAGALVALVSGLESLDGLGALLQGPRAPREYASLDAVRSEVDLRGPEGLTITAPLAQVRGFLLLFDPADMVCHLGLVLGDDEHYLPWLSTRDADSALALCVLFGHLTHTPALRLTSRMPLPERWRHAARTIAPPAELT